jgi:hypothetical protein
VPTMEPLDAYAPLGHYRMVADTGHNPAASWVPQDQRRRLAAYFVLDSLRKNAARNLMRRATWARRQKQREYGDPALFNTRIRSGVLGDDFELVLPGADDDLGDAPDLPEKPEDPGPEADDIEKRIFQIADGRWRTAADRIVDEWEQAVNRQPELQDRQQEIREWADRVQLRSLMVEGEEDCTGLGDTVYVLYPRRGDWPRVEVYEPDGYFPVLDTLRDGFPTKVHLAWEEEVELPDKTTKRRLHRLTWELVEISTLRERDQATDEGFGPTEGDVTVVDEEGVSRIGRRYPWSVATEEGGEAEVSTETCLFTRGVWELDASTLSKVPDLAESAALEIERTDLMVDHLPVIHIPNTPASRDHFGMSSLALSAQLFDDVGQTDTDLMETARLVMAPAIALTGAETKDQTIRPLAVFNLGKDGKMDVLDLSVGLEKAMSFAERLMSRLFVNIQVPATLVGKVTSADAPSGIAMLLDAAPFAGLIGTLRMTREPKYRLLLKFAQRMAQTAGVLDPGETPEAFVAFGSFLPLDKGQVVEHVVALLNAKAISRATAVALLVAGGFQIADARREIAQIEAEDFTGAVSLAEALASEDPAYDYLKRTPPEEDAQLAEPTVTLPEPGTQPGALPEPEPPELPPA